MSDRNAAQLLVIADVAERAAGVKAEIWLSGGWAMDFFLGRVTREHEDIDVFTLDGHLETLDETLRGADYRPVGAAPPEQQRDYAKDGVDLTIAPVRMDENGEPRVAGGPFGGEPWPPAMLRDAGWGRIGDLHARYIAPTAQIEIKEMTPVWVPGRPRRVKDARDIEAIRRALRESAHPG